MENFIYDIKTKVYFGQNQIENLADIVKKYGSKILLVYGGGSIKRNGIYQKIVDISVKNRINIIEFGGVEPNPSVDTARRGIALAKAEKVDAIVAVGGGSVLDCAKAIGAGFCYQGDVWDFYNRKAIIKESLPLIGIITLAASGSEMSIFSVLTNKETLEKVGAASNAIRFDEIIADPTYTFNVSAYHSAAGIADIMSHVLEGYFTDNEEYMQNRMAEAILKTCVEYGPIVIAEPDNYQARAQILWASSWALNSFISLGKKRFSSPCHLMEHILSAKYDISHGVGLAILTPHFLRFALNQKNINRYVEFGKNVYNLVGSDLEIAEKSIELLRKFFINLKIPHRLRDLGIKKEDLRELAHLIATRFDTKIWFQEATEEDILNIYTNAY